MNTALQIKAYAPIARRSWTVQEDTKLIKLLSKTNDYNYAAASLGRTYSSITNRAIHLGVNKDAKLRSSITPIDVRAAYKKIKPRKTKPSRTISPVSLLRTKIRNYRIIVSALALTQAATLAMLTI